MLGQFAVYKNLVIGGVILIIAISLWFYVAGLEDDIIELKLELKDTNIELANEKLQSTRYKSSLDIQNVQIVLLKADETLVLAKLKKWKAEPAEVRYKTITKIREVQSDECKDIKDAVNSVRGTSYDSL